MASSLSASRTHCPSIVKTSSLTPLPLKDTFSIEGAIKFIDDLFVSSSDIAGEDKKSIHEYIGFFFERLLLEGCNEDDWVIDPYLGTGTSIIAAIRNNRRGSGAEIVDRYIGIARERVSQEIQGTLRTRPMNKPIYDPEESGNKLTKAPWINEQSLHLLDIDNP